VGVVRSIIRLVMVASILSYIRKHLMKRPTNTINASRPDEQPGPDPRERAALEEQLREETRRYEADLRELAQT